MPVTVVGPLPPPINGFANATSKFISLLKQRTEVQVCNRAPSEKRPRALEESARWLAYARRQVPLRTRSRCTYIAVSGGLGQVIDIAYAAIAKWTGQRIVLHHHSFAYVDNRKNLTALLFQIAKSARHICLCDEMAFKLSRQYGINRELVTVVSNAVFVERGGLTAFRQEKLTIGYFSALTFEKGIDRFLDVVRSPLLRDRIDVKVAGPLPSNHSDELVRSLKEVHAEYLGLVENDAKDAYLQSLDVLLFPSRYKNEAEPIAILEAMSKGVAILATPRGCIGSMIVAGGQVLDEAEYCVKASSLIAGWYGERSVLEGKRQGAFAAFEEHHKRSAQRLSDLMGWMIVK